MRNQLPDSERTAQEAMHDDLNCAFLRSRHSALRSLRFEFSEKSLILRGKLPSFYLKQLAQTHAAQVATSHRIVNEIEVTDDSIVIS